MDRTPLATAPSDPVYDDGYPGPFEPAARPDQAATGGPAPHPSEDQADPTPSGDDAPPPDWQDRLTAAERRAMDAEARAQERDRVFAELRRTAQQQQEQTLEQQRALFQQQIANGDLTPDQIQQGNNYFWTHYQTQANEARSYAQQKEKADLLTGFKQHIIREHGLRPDEIPDLDALDGPAAEADPNAYWRTAQRIVANRSRYDALTSRLAALERDQDADARLASRMDSPGPGGAAPVGRPQDDPSSEDAYLSIPWQRRA